MSKIADVGAAVIVVTILGCGWYWAVQQSYPEILAAVGLLLGASLMLGALLVYNFKRWRK